MILELYIKNFILIEEATLRFGEGLNIITGETGSGKSILLNAISLCLGDRWDKTYARDKGMNTIVETTFFMEDKRLRGLLSEEFGIECMEDGMIIVSRELTCDGKSISKINGRNIKLGRLKNIVGMIIDIHSQHETYDMFDKEKYLYYLDQYGKKQIDPCKAEYANIYSKYREIREQIRSLSGDRDEKQIQREIDLLQFQIDEIEQAELENCNIDEMEREIDKLRNMKSIEKTIMNCYSTLYSSNFNACDFISQVNKDLQDIACFDSKLENFQSSIEGVYHTIVEISREIRLYSDSMSFDDMRLEQLEDSLSAINNLKRKYGNTIEEILKYKSDISKSLDEILNRDNLIEDLMRQKDEIESVLKKAATKLSESRRAVAQKFEQKIKNEVRSLNNNYAEFKIELNRKPEYENSGIDDIMFMVSFNLGEEILPLNKVASGGEISRFMLALKNVITEFETVGTLIFDEIDTGISGITAQVVGGKLREISKKKQIICITHLPQIAVNSDCHFKIQKTIMDKRVQTSISKLSEEGKVNEIARLMGGLNITQTTIKSAKEILNMARNN
ncbi:DNA repair protein RecN (Recombination protein N) [Peptoclostridium litorale DSM 5388]|uniref:DNA repair protein RecN n=1 Tax=Peptoclostridium litorale DSM 5388 TaxID=1121324 RepID=A0A069RIS4_PEPLI|nr:DNA repair protein RecN [Peptoclostridium litorale]KDR94117.1 DNA repair protein RecN [Peptoclostridium litorale DSM 5388]SIN81082.1 DNA repair protein RecN (Recombination protein N) [Peptoclostridium litorale DSM 5388]